MNRKKVLRCMAAVCVVMLMMASAYAENAILTGNTAVYDEASASGMKLGTVELGTEVTVMETHDGWAKIQKDGHTGFVKSSALTKSVNITAYAAENNVRVYATCSTGSDIVATLKRATGYR